MRTILTWSWLMATGFKVTMEIWDDYFRIRLFETVSLFWGLSRKTWYEGTATLYGVWLIVTDVKSIMLQVRLMFSTTSHKICSEEVFFSHSLRIDLIYAYLFRDLSLCVPRIIVPLKRGYSWVILISGEHFWNYFCK